jgi:hypothetical protein
MQLLGEGEVFVGAQGACEPLPTRLLSIRNLWIALHYPTGTARVADPHAVVWEGGALLKASPYPDYVFFFIV